MAQSHNPYARRPRRRHLVAAPVAFRGTPAAHRIDAREIMRPLVGTLGYHFQQPHLAEHIARLERPDLFNGPESDTFPGRDAIGRRNPRMQRRPFA